MRPVFANPAPQRRARIGIEPQFVEWREAPTKSGSSPVAELQ